MRGKQADLQRLFHIDIALCFSRTVYDERNMQGS